MKIQILIIVLTGLTIGHVHADKLSVMHAFTDLQGRTTSAQITDVNVSARKVLLQRADSVKAWVSIDALCSEDLDYIEGWCNSHTLLSAENLRVSTRQAQTVSSTTRTESASICETSLYSKITMANQSVETIKNLRIDYCYYIGSYSSADGDSIDPALLDDARIESGSIVIGSLGAGQDIVVDTDNVVLNTTFKLQKESNVFGTSVTEVPQQEESVLAITFEVYGSGNSGILSKRELGFPDSITAGI